MEIIDFSILFTQIVGFLIVLWVLRKVAWGPILGKLEERRQKIAGDVSSAEQLRRDAEELKAKYEEEIRTIEVQSRERIQLAVQEGQKVAEEIRADARKEADLLKAKVQADIRSEYEKARASLKEDVVKLALGAAERLVSEEMDTDRQRKLVEKFLADVPGLKTQ